MNNQKFTSSPIGLMLLYFNVIPNIVPSIPPRRGPIYGIMLNIPVRNAIPNAAFMPSLAIRRRPRKFSRATPSISSTTPIKYLDSRYPISVIAFSVFSSCLSGTSEHTILVNRPSSLIKKKPMNTTEKRPMPRLVINDAAEPITVGNIAGLNRCWNSWNIAISIRKSGPSEENLSRKKLLNSASGSEMLLTTLSIFEIDTPFTMLLTSGIITNTIETMMPTTSKSDRVASSQDGADFPFILIFLNITISGFAISETTTAIRIYAKTLLKYQHAAQPAVTPAASSISFASLSTDLSFELIVK